MAKAPRKKTVIRTAKNMDEKYLGTEPVLSDDPGRSELMRARSWYNYFYDVEGSRKFLLQYLKETKAPKESQAAIRAVSKADLYNIGITVGWNARILFRGGNLPQNARDITKSKIEQLIKLGSNTTTEDSDKPKVPTVSIQQRMYAKAAQIVGLIEDELYKEIESFHVSPKFEFKTYEFLQGIEATGATVALTADRWNSELEELQLAYTGKDNQCVEAYAGYEKKHLKFMVGALQSIVDDVERYVINTKKVRKPRKVKDTPAAKQVAKIKYKTSDKELKLNSVNPLHLIGAAQLWVFNTKYRTLTVYHALGRDGLGMKGTTIQGFDAEASITRKLRKPQLTLGQILKGAKIKCKKVMNELTTKTTVPTGRINTETILLKVIK